MKFKSIIDGRGRIHEGLLMFVHKEDLKIKPNPNSRDLDELISAIKKAIETIFMEPIYFYDYFDAYLIESHVDKESKETRVMTISFYMRKTFYEERIAKLIKEQQEREFARLSNEILLNVFPEETRYC